MKKVYIGENMVTVSGTINVVFDVKIKDLDIQVDADAEFEEDDLYFVDFNEVIINGVPVYENSNRNLVAAFHGRPEEEGICFSIRFEKTECGIKVLWEFDNDVDVDKWVAGIKKELNKI